MENEFNSLSYSVNNSNLMKSYNNNNTNLRNFSNNSNLMNEFNLKNINHINSINNNIKKSEKEISIIFRKSDSHIIDHINEFPKNEFPPYCIYCKPDDKICEMIEKFFETAKINDNYKKYFIFIFNGKILDIYSSLALREYGITNNANIYILPGIKINFKISNDFLYIKSGIICLDKITVYSLIKDFLDETGIKGEDIKNYIYNNKIINQKISLQYAGLYDNSEIIVKLNKQIQYIKIIFKSEDEKEIYKFNCLKTEKISSIKRKLEENAGKGIWKLIFNKKEITDEEKRAEALGIKDNSVIYF